METDKYLSQIDWTRFVITLLHFSDARKLIILLVLHRFNIQYPLFLHVITFANNLYLVIKANLLTQKEFFL